MVDRGEHVVIRLLPQSGHALTLKDLGLSPGLTRQYRRLLDNPSGLVLIVGPTGSGKTTTLSAGLQELADDGTRKVITVEDPIEYAIDNIQQTRVRNNIGFTFADAMRSFVRQDPDVILVGEIRDGETALEAVRASQTGHLVLSTLHCNDSVDAIQRLFDLGLHRNSLASELLAIMAQRLAKRICPDCKVPAEPDPQILRELFPQQVPDNFRCFVGQGCPQCNGRGTRGRTAVVEFLQINGELRDVISRQPPLGELRWRALDAGLVTMRDSALELVLQGVIPLSELPGAEKFWVYDSLLSEYAALGFEYGYAHANPEALVLWEAQFGDFVNGAQIIIDQYLVAAEDKWGQHNALVMLLPHGYEGQGPEHSSARIERFLTLCAEDNIQVVNATTAAQFFHVLRRQMHREIRKPLVIFTPKGPLRMKEVRSKIADLEPGTSFQEVLDDPFVTDAASVKRVVFCSGKVVWDALAERDKRQAAAAIVRVEQLYPFPLDQINEAIVSTDQYDMLKEYYKSMIAKETEKIVLKRI